MHAQKKHTRNTPPGPTFTHRQAVHLNLRARRSLSEVVEGVAPLSVLLHAGALQLHVPVVAASLRGHLVEALRSLLECE